MPIQPRRARSRENSRFGSLSIPRPGSKDPRGNSLARNSRTSCCRSRSAGVSSTSENPSLTFLSNRLWSRVFFGCPQESSEHLSTGVPRDLVDKAHLANVLVPGQSIGHIRDDVLFTEGGTSHDYHGRLGHLATAAIGHSEYGTVTDRGMGKENLFNFGRRNLEPTYLYHLFGSIGEMNPSLWLDPANITGAHPPARQERLRIRLFGQVPHHLRRAPNHDLAGPTKHHVL